MASSSNKQDTIERDFSDFQSPHEASLDRLVKAVDRAYHRPWLMMWRSFLSGMMAGIGATVGTALILILSGYLFQVLGGQVIFKEVLGSIQQSINQTQNQTRDSLDRNY